MNSLLLTVAALRMLVPRNIVAEVLGPSFLEFARDEATGVVFFGWRGRRVPLLGAAMIGATGNRCQSHISDFGREAGEESKIAILHGLKHQQLLPFYGFAVTRSPRLLRVSEGDVQEVTGVPLQPAELMRVRVNGVEACIPKVDHFESTLIDLLQPRAGKSCN